MMPRGHGEAEYVVVCEHEDHEEIDGHRHPQRLYFKWKFAAEIQADGHKHECTVEEVEGS